MTWYYLSYLVRLWYHLQVQLTRKSKVEDITCEDIENIEYAEISDENMWRVNIIREITNKKFNQLEINGFSEEECEEILQYACVS